MDYVDGCRRGGYITTAKSTAMADGIDNVYYIPKGATMLGNLWAIRSNPADLPELDQFRPERFLDRFLAH